MRPLGCNRVAQALLEYDTYYSAEEAQQMGIVDKISGAGLSLHSTEQGGALAPDGLAGSATCAEVDSSPPDPEGRDSGSEGKESKRLGPR